VFWRVSHIHYSTYIGGDTRQALVVTEHEPDEVVHRRWNTRAVGSCQAPEDPCDLVRDILNNPQVRVVVLEGEGPRTEAIRAFWSGTAGDAWGLRPPHAALVRDFVDLFDGDYTATRVAPPFWPKRIKYSRKDGDQWIVSE
jgi:hypothetical protein